MTTDCPSLKPHSPLNLAYLEQNLLPHIFKPGRYLGMEQGAFNKPFETAQATMALAFPDVYEIGASSYAIKLLYSVVNNDSRFLCDRVYAPAEDFRALLKAHTLPLYGVESKRPLKAFDVVAVSLQYELNYTTALGVLEAGQLELRAANRAETDPLIVAGGPGATNPNPLWPFFDAFLIGDGEELLIEMMAVLATARQEGWSKRQKLEALAELDGMLVPEVKPYASKRIFDIGENEIAIAPLIPAVEAIHDRVTVEARRGCDRMCRFCQPAFINLPAREKTPEQIKTLTLKGLEETGYEECSLLSLSIADYSQFKELVMGVAGGLKEKNASLSLSSQRADRFSLDVAEAVQSVRKSTLTFAPEAGTARLRDVINKNLTDKEILNAVTTAFRAGWNKVKLYFMIGLPTETQTDLDGIVELVQKMKTACQLLSRDEGLSKRKHLEINVTLSNFVPKPHTPFQWHPQDSRADLQEKIQYLRGRLKAIKGVKANFTTPEISKLEAVISRGGQELANVLELAYRKGAYLDAWDETKPFAKWFEALEELEICPEEYTQQRFTSPEDELPWDCVDVGLEKQWMVQEWERSMKAASTTPCFEACSVCGVCGTFNVWPAFTEPTQALNEMVAAQEAEPQAAKEAIESTLKQGAVQRWRLQVQKQGLLKYSSHLDWMRMLQRALRRADLPMAYSQGFNPKPKLSFGPALPLFVSSEGEYVDLELISPITNPKTQLIEALNTYLPTDAQVLSAVEVPLSTKSIEASLKAIDYELYLEQVESPETLQQQGLTASADLSSTQMTCGNADVGLIIEEHLKQLLQLQANSNPFNTGAESSPEICLPIHGGPDGSKPQSFRVSSFNNLCWQPFSASSQAITPNYCVGVLSVSVSQLPNASGSLSWAKPQWLCQWLLASVAQSLGKAQGDHSGYCWRIHRKALHLAPTSLTGLVTA